MPVISSQNFPDSYTQRDGRRYVTEQHALNHGDPIRLTYLAAVGTDYDAVMNARVPRLNERLAQQEYEALINDDAPTSVTLYHQTAAEFVDRVRAAYRDSRGLECARLAWWLGERIVAGQITQAQLQAAFGMDSTQWATFRDTKLLPQHDAYAASLAAEGE